MNRSDKYTLNIVIEVVKKMCVLRGGGVFAFTLLCCTYLAKCSQPNHRISFPFMANGNDNHVVSKLT